jgi:hypothetical protein
MACGGDDKEEPVFHSVTAADVEGGYVAIGNGQVRDRYMTMVTVVPAAHYQIASVKGCSGKLEGTYYTTGSILADCVITATFTLQLIKASAASVVGGAAAPAMVEAPYNTYAKFTITADDGYRIKSVVGCGGTLVKATFTTDRMTAPCTVTPIFEIDVPVTPAATSVSLTGVAAEGAALSSSSVTAKCADGSGFISAVITDTQGNFSGQVASTALPCALKVSNAATSYYSVATKEGRVNITPLTSLIVSFASQQKGADWLANSNWQEAIPQLAFAQTLFGAALSSAGYTLPNEAFLPFTVNFQVGDDWDKVLDQLQVSLKNSNLADFDALVNLIKDGNLISLPAAK